MIFGGLLCHRFSDTTGTKTSILSRNSLAFLLEGHYQGKDKTKQFRFKTIAKSVHPLRFCQNAPAFSCGCILVAFKGEVRTINDRNICERRSCMKNNGKSPTFKFVSGAERRPSEVQRVSRSCRPLTPRTRQRIPLESENDWKFRLRSCQRWKASSLSLGVVVPTSINKYRMRYIGLGRDNLRSHFIFRPCHAPEWLRARFLPVIFLANEGELTGKIFSTSLNTTNPNTYMKFIFLRTSPLRQDPGPPPLLRLF